MTTAESSHFSAAPIEHANRLRAWVRSFAYRVAMPLTSSRGKAFTVPILNKGATFWIARPLGRQIVCEAGALWLTFDNEPEDVILKAGQRHLCAKRSKLGIHAMVEAKVLVN